MCRLYPTKSNSDFEQDPRTKEMWSGRDITRAPALIYKWGARTEICETLCVSVLVTQQSGVARCPAIVVVLLLARSQLCREKKFCVAAHKACF